MKNFVVPSLLALSLLALLALSATTQAAEQSNASGSGSSSKSSTSTQPRQSPGSSAAALIGTLGSLVPGLISNVAPLMLLFGLGALMMPSLGLGALGLLRESRRSSNEQVLPNMGAFAQYARPLQTSPQDIYYFTKRSLPSLMSGVNGAALVHGLQNLLERVAKAIDNADKQYN